MNKNEQRAELFLKEVAPLLSTYQKKWQTYFSEIGLEFDIDILMIHQLNAMIQYLDQD